MQTPDSSPQPLPPSIQIAEVFDAADGALLILGAPGAGKTTTMLDLARDLLARAARDDSHPLPVVFNLSSWAERRKPMTEWMVDELNLRYDVPRKLAQVWIDTDRVLPLLDGLDEVATEYRAACVKAINVFRHAHGLLPIVVCSRRAEYEKLSEQHQVRLKLTTAVLLQPLTNEQVECYLSALGDGALGLRQALATGENLRELAETPLMLSILLLTYHDQDAAAIMESAGAVGETQTAPSHAPLFAAYLERMFKRRGKDDRYSRKQTTHWLVWLARTMNKRDETTFYLENLQPEWLPCDRARSRYRIQAKLAGGLTFGLAFGLISGLLAGLLSGLLTGLIFGLVGLLIVGDHVAILGEASLSWRLVWPVGLVIGLVIGLFGGLVFGIRAGLLAGLVYGLIVGLTNVLLFGLVRQRIVVRAYPNQGIQRSGRSALVAGLVIGLLSGLSSGLVFGIPAGLFGGLLGGVLTALSYGGIAFLNHFFLRLVLWQERCLPWRLVTFLDCAAERILLRKVGGGYIFVHRYLQDYFASLDV